MNTNKKFVNNYLSFCKRLSNFTNVSKELDAEIEGMNELVKDPEAVNFAQRAQAKLRKFSQVLTEAVKGAEELSDSTADLEKEVVKTDFSKATRKVKILNKVFSDLEKELKSINEDVKEVIEESVADGQLTTTQAAEPAQPGVVPAQPSDITQSEPVSPAQPEVVDGNAELNKKVAVNFSKKNYLFSQVKSIAGKYKQFSDELEGSSDLIEEITDEVTVEAEPSKPASEEAAAAAAEAPAEEQPKDEFGDAAELADGIAQDIAEDDFNETEAVTEVEKTENFAKKDAAKKLISAFGKVKKHFDDKIEAIKKDIKSTPTVDPKDLTPEEAKSLISEFKCFSDKNSKSFSKRLARKMTSFSEVCEECADGKASTEDVVDAAQDVVDVMDKVEEKPAEFQEFSEKVQKFIKMFSEDVTSENAEVISAPSPEVLEKDGQINSTLDSINGKIDTLDLNATVTNFAKLSSKSLSAIKCFSMEDVNNKLALVEQFAECAKALSKLKNYAECPVCGKEPCECTPEEMQAGADAMSNLCKKFCDDAGSLTDTEKKQFMAISNFLKKFSEEAPAEEKPAEETPAPAEEKPAEEKPAEGTPAEPPKEETPAEEKPAEETPAETPTEGTPAEQPAEPPAEETPAEEPPAEEKPAEEKPAEPSEEEVVLKNFSRSNSDYGKRMAHLAHMV